MNILDINGNRIKIRIDPEKFSLKRTFRSDLQSVVAERLTNKYPHDTILEDFTIPGSKLSVDFFIPNRRLVIECNGQQHDHYVSFYHGDRGNTNFAKQKNRDAKKSYWCEINSFQLIEVWSEDDISKIDG